jgi:hypothetical protein
VQLAALDFTAHPDCIIVPIQSWIRANQPDLVDNPDRREKGFRFEAEYKGTAVLDLIIELDLTEAVRVVRMPPADPSGATPDRSPPWSAGRSPTWKNPRPRAHSPRPSTGSSTTRTP